MRFWALLCLPLAVLGCKASLNEGTTFPPNYYASGPLPRTVPACAGPIRRNDRRDADLDVTRINRSKPPSGKCAARRPDRCARNNAGFGVAPLERKRVRSNKHSRSSTRTFRRRPDDARRCTRDATARRGTHHQHRLGTGLLANAVRALYAATKHAVEGYSESLDHELRTLGIRVSVIEPGYTRTPFDANFLEPDATLEEYRERGDNDGRSGEPQ